MNANEITSTTKTRNNLYFLLTRARLLFFIIDHIQLFRQFLHRSTAIKTEAGIVKQFIARTRIKQKIGYKMATFVIGMFPGPSFFESKTE